MPSIEAAERRLASQTGESVDRSAAKVALARAFLVRSPQRALSLALEVASTSDLPVELLFDALHVGASARLIMSDFAGASTDLDRLGLLAASHGQRARIATLVAIRAQRSGDLTGALNHILEALRLWEGAEGVVPRLHNNPHRNRLASASGNRARAPRSVASASSYCPSSR
jgi:hypothetical protein